MAFDRRVDKDLKFDRVVSYNLKDGEEIDRNDYRASRQRTREVLIDGEIRLNADGTIAIKGEAAEQLKALIREVLANLYVVTGKTGG